MQKMPNFQGKINIYNKSIKEMKQVTRITEDELKKIINESVAQILKESSAAEYDLQSLRAMYQMAQQIEEYANKTNFGNSPIIEYTTKIMQYCTEQTQRVKQS